ESLRRTFLRRPDLLENYPLSEEERKWISEWKNR
ncbi:tRNA (guanosine(37)-N1)-methyltransferase TrmD, partial [Bacillus haynesii]|nr:tRNA (guanosine(37)-N1)-methyltransferase TrmD [Bacillus haynesii]